MLDTIAGLLPAGDSLRRLLRDNQHVQQQSQLSRARRRARSWGFSARTVRRNRRCQSLAVEVAAPFAASWGSGGEPRYAADRW